MSSSTNPLAWVYVLNPSRPVPVFRRWFIYPGDGLRPPQTYLLCMVAMRCWISFHSYPTVYYCHFRTHYITIQHLFQPKSPIIIKNLPHPPALPASLPMPLLATQLLFLSAIPYPLFPLPPCPLELLNP